MQRLMQILKESVFALIGLADNNTKTWMEKQEFYICMIKINQACIH